MKLRLLVGLLVLWTCAACDSPAIFKETVDFDGNRWYVRQVPSFAFTIEEPQQPYSIYYNLRNTSTYPYYNLYVTRTLLDSAGRVLDRKLDQLQLADATTGKPLGSGLGDLYDHKILAMKAFRFPYKGKYTITIQQYMRQNPLPEIQSVGLSIERIP
jgi:gliding motility-associated lipoprotein GldH